MSTRYTQRINGTLLKLIAEGLKGNVKHSKDPDQEDGSIDIEGHPVHIQIDAFSGDPVSVGRKDQEDGEPVFRFWDVESDDQLIPAVKQAIAFTPPVKA